MPERDALVGAVAHEQARVERLAQRRARRGRAALEHRVRGLAAGGGDDREQRAGRVGDRRDAQGDHVGDGRRDLVATVAPGGEQLLDEERVPARALVQIVDERCGHGLAGDLLELAGDIFTCRAARGRAA